MTTRSVLSTSDHLWDLDWRAVLPWTFEDVAIEAGSFDDALPFIEQHYARCFPTVAETAPFFAEPMTPAKRRFGDAMDVFLMRHEGRTVGVVMGHPSDWSSYYARSGAVLPEFRDRHLMGRVLAGLADPLRRAGVTRLETEVSVGNAPALRMMARLGWLITATTNSDRWGAMVRFTKLLHEEAETTFVQHYCGVHVKPTPVASSRARAVLNHQERSPP